MLARVMDQFLERWGDTPQMAEILAAASGSSDNLVISGARAGAAPALLALLAEKITRPTLVVTSSLERAETLTDGIAFFNRAPSIFPSFETLPFEVTEPVVHLLSARNLVLNALAKHGGKTADHAGDANLPAPLIIAPIDALAFRPLPREGLRAQTVNIRWGEPQPIEALAAKLVEMGYTREALVESPGEFSVRGSIVDVFPPDSDLPWRFDFFGDDLDQIRRFDASTQRSLPIEKEVEGVEIIAAAIQAPKLAWLDQGRQLGSFFDLLPRETLVILDGPARLNQRLAHMQETAARHWHDLQKPRRDEEPNPLVKHGGEPGDWMLEGEAVREGLARFQRIELADFSLDAEEGLIPRGKREFAPRHIALPAQSFEAIPSKFDEYLGLFRERLRKGNWIVIVCDNNGQVLRLDELLREQDMPAVTLDDERGRGALPVRAEDDARALMLCTGQLHDGFHDPGAGIMVVTDREIFGRYKRRHIYRKAFRGKAVASATEIQRGDYVVHMEHGIGHFEGIRRQIIDGRAAEFIELIYQDDARLLVPVEKLHMVQKYAGADNAAPKLDKLGSKKWATRRKKSMEAVRKLAGELLELYARRAAAEGSAYGPDTVWQREFEASFIYQETPDQLEAIDRVKKDMMAPKPMDRLLCGDVGYGKTEVAIRAAFKAVTEKRQVAILAPTTLLVSQHFTTFKERFADYPFKVEMLSRFRSAKEQNAIIEKLKGDEIDLIVGTHRLLGRDVQFRDLGLLVVDEEQRFGVAQKERIKSLRSNVDILTLTATPIPRTLYMALAGLRDLSVINTPPANRHPIKTRTIRWDREQIEEAILRELNRGGQVFFIHNRVQNIEEIVGRIKEIVPRARIAFGHGQMDEEELEQIMLDFIAGKYDILVSTTIIENGIDIPNVNTIIINRADAFGLAQLYQLRGRVGRDVRQAYAYLILPPGTAITPQAVKRLEALEEFTELGAGFSIAMRDMEIRGTGNILGRDQHGAICDIGFELYCRMLEEAVQELQGGPTLEPLWPVEVKWPAAQLIPEEYIPVESQRIRFYKDIAAARSRDGLEMLIEELADRYGTLPQPAVNLVNAARVRLAAAEWRVDVVRKGPDGNARITAPTYATELAAAMAERAAAGRKVFSKLRRQGDVVVLEVRETDEDFTDDEILAGLADFMEALPPLSA